MPTVAMVGAGQLAQMTHQAAISLGVELRVLAGSEDEPAVRAGAPHMLGSVEVLADLERFAEGADVLTFDHEGVPPEHLAALEAAGVPMVPSPSAQLLAQDKLAARTTLAEAGFPIPPFAHVRDVATGRAFGAEHGWPLIGKAPRGGYDGRGVFELPGEPDLERALTGHPGGLLVEPRLALESELAVIVARSPSAECVAYEPVETVQEAAMCREILAPAPAGAELSGQARELALAIADAIGATGILAVELFVTDGGLLVNELALRPHNSGHGTIEANETSQFEQHLRAALDWPLGSVALTAPAAVTVNVVGTAGGGDPRRRAPQAAGVQGAHLHLYGKAPRPARKLGHVTATGPDVEAARAVAWRAVSELEQEPAA